MRKIILGLAVSLDSKIEGPNGEYDWCFTDQDYGMGDFLKSVDGVIYGRKSYELIMKSGNPFSAIRSYVVSGSLSQRDDYTLLRSVEEVATLKRAEGKDLWLFGGASLTSSLLKAGLVDEMWLAVHPIVLGPGKNLFEDVVSRVPLKLLSHQAYSTGLVSLRYEIVS